MRLILIGCEYAGTTTTTVDETVAKFAEQIQPHLTESDLMRFLLRQGGKI